MARLSRAEAAEAVTSAITANGGTVNHEQLVNALEANKQSRAVEHLINLIHDGTVTAQVVAVDAGTNELRYSVGGNS